jgi:hypothetical protein
MNGGTHPGKLLNGYCNVSFGNKGTQYQSYEVAVISGGDGHWGAWNAADKSNMLIGGHEADGSPLYICHANYHNGIHPGKLVPAGTCDFEWGGTEYSTGIGNGQVFYLTPGPIVATSYQPNYNPGCSGLSAIDARTAIWQSPTSISRGQTVTVWVPSAGGIQTWHVIDHGHNDQNTAVGNGVVAGDGFIRPGFPEGALLVRGADQIIRSFAEPDGRFSFTAPPGQIAFIANDNYKWNNHPIPPGFGFYGNGFDDNSGSITVGFSLDPCPLPPLPQTTPPPVAGCNKPGGPKCCEMPGRDYYCGLVAQPYRFPGCRAESKTGPVSCTQMICVDDGVNNTFTPPTCSPPVPTFSQLP